MSYADIFFRAQTQHNSDGGRSAARAQEAKWQRQFAARQAAKYRIPAPSVDQPSTIAIPGDHIAIGMLRNHPEPLRILVINTLPTTERYQTAAQIKRVLSEPEIANSRPWKEVQSEVRENTLTELRKLKQNDRFYLIIRPNESIPLAFKDRTVFALARGRDHWRYNDSSVVDRSLHAAPPSPSPPPPPPPPAIPAAAIDIKSGIDPASVAARRKAIQTLWNIFLDTRTKVDRRVETTSAVDTLRAFFGFQDSPLHSDQPYPKSADHVRFLPRPEEQHETIARALDRELMTNNAVYLADLLAWIQETNFAALPGASEEDSYAKAMAAKMAAYLTNKIANNIDHSPNRTLVDNALLILNALITSGIDPKIIRTELETDHPQFSILRWDQKLPAKLQQQLGFTTTTQATQQTRPSGNTAAPAKTASASPASWTDLKPDWFTHFAETFVQPASASGYFEAGTVDKEAFQAKLRNPTSREALLAYVERTNFISCPQLQERAATALAVLLEIYADHLLLLDTDYPHPDMVHDVIEAIDTIMLKFAQDEVSNVKAEQLVTQRPAISIVLNEYNPSIFRLLQIHPPK